MSIDNVTGDRPDLSLSCSDSFGSDFFSVKLFVCLASWQVAEKLCRSPSTVLRTNGGALMSLSIFRSC
jgi:hypothetical protein